MSGHSHWAGIKHKKGAADQKRGRIFSKLLAAVTAAARSEQNPDFNPRLRTAIEKAREANVPSDNIERAVKRAGETGNAVEDLILEAYGPGGAAILIEATTDNKNRTIAEIKKILSENKGKWAETGSVRWAFAPLVEGGWQARFSPELGEEDSSAIKNLLEELDTNDDVQKVYTTAKLA